MKQYYQFVKSEEKKLEQQRKRAAVAEWIKIVGHKIPCLVLHDPHNLPKPAKHIPCKKITLAEARILVREEIIQRQHAIKMADGNYKYHFTI